MCPPIKIICQTQVSTVRVCVNKMSHVHYRRTKDRRKQLFKSLTRGAFPSSAANGATMLSYRNSE